MAFKEGVLLGPVSINATGAATTTINGIVNIGVDNTTNAITIGTGTGGRTINIGLSAANNLLFLGTANGTSATNIQAGSGNLILNSTGGTATLDATSGVSINSTAGALNLGDGANAQNINIGTAGSGRVITIGNFVGATELNLLSGTGGIAIDSTDFIILDADTTIQINSSGGTLNIGDDADAFGINIGTGGAARTITIGNNTGATAVNVDIGTGDYTLDSGTGNIITANDTGEIRYPLQPAFLATHSVSQDNVTGAGTTVTINFTTEIYDQNSDYDGTNTFTAPITGRYLFSSYILVADLTALMTLGNFNLVASNRGYIFLRANYAAIFAVASNLIMGGSAMVDMDAADTCHMSIQVSNGAGDTVDLTASTASIFCGALIC